MAAVDSIGRGAAYFAFSYAADLAVLINGNLIVNLNIAAVHNDGGSTVGNLVAGYVDICQFAALISIYAILGCDRAGGFDSTVGTADVYIFAGQVAKDDILVQVNLVNLLTVIIKFFNIDVGAVYNLAVFACFGCYCMQLAAVYSVSGISGYCACCYAGNLAVFSNSYFTKLSTFSGDLAVVAVCIAYEQLAVTQCSMFVEYAVFQNYIADNTFVSSYLAEFSLRSNQFAVFVYNQFAVCSIECAVAVYKERHSTICICSTYGQVVFCVQCVGLDGVYTGHVAFFIDGYLTKFSGFRSDLAVVAACIAYEQLAVTQCGMTGVYAVVQNYVACGYIAVFIYYKVAVCTIECTVAIYEERYSAICICSTYGQVVFCVQCIGLNIVYINVFVQLNLNLSAVMAYADVLVAAEINEIARFNVGCLGCNTVGGKIPAHVCSCAYSLQLAYVYSISISSTCSYAMNLAVCSNSYFAQLSTFSGDLAVVAACIAYEQLAVTQCGMTGVYAVVQNYVACGYIAVFIYYKVAVCTIECTVAVYEERYSAVFICSTYGQVVFCVQGIGLDGVYTGNVAFFIDSYLTEFSGFRSDLAVAAACIAYEQLAITQCGMTGVYAIVQNYVACGYIAVFIYYETAVCTIECTVAVYEERYSAVFICSTYGQVVFCVQGVGLNIVYINVFIQLNLNLSSIIAYTDVLITAKVNISIRCYISSRGSIAVSGKIPAFICNIFYFFQLSYVCSISISYAFCYVANYIIISIQTALGDVSFTAKTNALLIIHEEVTSIYAVNIKISVQVNLNKGSILVFFLAYGNIFIATAEVNSSTGFNISRAGDCILGGKIPAFIGICSNLFDFFQLAYVYSVGIISTCCNIGNLTFSVSAAYGYCISSVSYAAYTQSNTAFSRYRSTTADSNSLISRNRIFMTERNNIASVTDFVLVTHYNGIRNIVQFIVRACHEYVMATLFLITDKLVVIADNGRISLFGNSVGTADNCYSTALLFSENRIVAEQNIKTFACANIHIFIGIGNLIAGTLNSYAIRCLNGVCRAHNIISYAGINLAIFIIYSIFRAHNSCRCTLNNHIFLNSTKERNMYLSFIRSSVTVNYRISTYNSSIQAAGISISTYKSSALATADSIRAQRGSFIACMCFVAKSNTAAAIAASNNTCAITDSNRILNCRCTFTNFNLGIIRCRITSHRRSHACTGHNTCCNQHCQQFFGGAAFCAMVFSHFRNNDICVASFTPNYFENFVHQKFLPHKYYLYTVRDTCRVWKQVKQLLYNYPCTDVAIFQHPLF